MFFLFIFNESASVVNYWAMEPQIKQYSRLVKPYWTCRESLWSWACLFGALGLSLLVVYVSINMNQLTGEFYDFIAAKDKEKIVDNLIQTAKMIALYMVLFSVQDILESLMNFRWREWMTKNLLRKWLDKRAYYFQLQEVDNPDQRISEDIRLFCSRCTSIFYLLFHNVVSLSSFFVVLWNFSSPLTFSIFGTTFVIPHYLALVSIFYAILFNVFTAWVGKPLVSLDYEQERREADFRYALFRVKEYGEEIAFNRGEKFEEKIFEKRFSFLARNYYKLLRRKFYINLTQNAHMHIAVILPTALSLPLLLSGEISLGGIMQVGSAFTSVLISFCTLSLSYQQFASLQATKNRLFGFLQSSEQAGNERPESLIYKTHRENEISFSNISIFNPSDKPIISGVDFTVFSGEKVLVMGRSGLGKTSLLRTLAKLWKHAKGEITLPKKSLFFIPQKPYFPLATLKDCITYPLIPEKTSDSKSLAEILEAVSLPHLIPLLEEEKDWGRSLSLGEQQRLNFARILFHKPQVLILDEPTSSLDAEKETHMFELLKQRLEKATILTISHSEALKSHHDRCITFTQSTQNLIKTLSQASQYYSLGNRD